MQKKEIISIIHYDDYKIPVHLPVAGKIKSINDILLSGDQNVLLQQPEQNG